MLIMAALTYATTVLYYFLAYISQPSFGQVPSPSIRGASEASKISFTPPGKCTNNIMSNIWTSQPKCQPRPTLIRIPLPEDPDVLEVIPSHVLVDRCGGVCHEGNTYHNCVPSEGAKSTKAFPVMLRKVVHDNGIPECTEVEVEVHEHCKCGCDIGATTCSSMQTYDHHFCKCRCTNLPEQKSCHKERWKKMWDPQQCRCVCRPEMYRECSTGFVYDPVNTCDCIREHLAPRMAGMEVIVPLTVVTLALLVTSLLLGWKLRQVMQAKPNVEEGAALNPQSL